MVKSKTKQKDCNYSAMLGYRGGWEGGGVASNDYKKPGLQMIFYSFGGFILITQGIFLSERRPFCALGSRTDDPRHRVRFSTVTSRTRNDYPPERMRFLLGGKRKGFFKTIFFNTASSAAAQIQLCWRILGYPKGLLRQWH
jgi:hypothetical protein